MKLKLFHSKFLLTVFLQLLVHANNAVARGSSSGTCRGSINECGGTAILCFSLIAFVVIYFKVLNKRPQKDCPSFLLTLVFVGISIAVAFLIAIVASSVIGLSLSWAWLLACIICFVLFAYLLNLSSRN